jgi:DNA-directed RNA polymerase specialized sigma24 family protein
LQAIAVWKMEGHTNHEIAAKLGCAPSTVERRLQLIRQIWEKGAGA